MFKCLCVPSFEEIKLTHETNKEQHRIVFYNKALNFVVIQKQSFCLFGNPFLKKGNISGMGWRLAPDLELYCRNSLNKSFNLFLLFLPSFLSPFLLPCVK